MGHRVQFPSLTRQSPIDRRNFWLLSACFFGFVLFFSLNRYFTFYASYDHGLFNQVFWNNLHGHWFQSSLTGANSIEALEEGKVAPVTFSHFGNHFVPDFVLWLPIYALFPSPVTLVVLQVVLMTVGGWVLYALARIYLAPALALMIMAGYFTSSAVMGPTFANFYEQCQIPLFAFSLLLALEKQQWWLFWLMALLVLGIREDAGFITFGVGLYLMVSRRHPWIGAVLCLISFGYVVLVTNLIIPHFSEHASKVYLSSRFQQFVSGNPNPTTTDVLVGMITRPGALLSSLLTPLDKKLFYLFRQWLPLAFVPAIAPVSWIVAGPPLLSLILQEGKSALSITLRYSISVVPGLFYGTILWWSTRPQQLKPRFRRFWIGCIILSLIMTIGSNPNRAFSFLIPDSFVPWVHVSLPRQWQHANYVRSVTRVIPADASVAATTYVIPHLSGRREIVRLPALKLVNDQGQTDQMDYIVLDLWQLQQYQPAFREDRNQLKTYVPLVDQLLQTWGYGVIAVEDGVVILQRGVASNPNALAQWQQLRAEVAPILVN